MTAPHRDRSHCHLHLIVDVFVVFQQRIAESQGRCCCRVEEFTLRRGSISVDHSHDVSFPVVSHAMGCLSVVSLSMTALTNAVCVCVQGGALQCHVVLCDARRCPAVLPRMPTRYIHDALRCPRQPDLQCNALCDALCDALCCHAMPHSTAHDALQCPVMPRDRYVMVGFSAW